MNKVIYILFLLFFHSTLFSQVVVKPSEKLFYSFETTGKKLVLISFDTVHYKVIYRFGTKTNTELEISHDTSSYSCDHVDTSEYCNTFSYNFYYRWGGAENLGENDNHFEFINNGFFYTIFSEYAAVDNKTNIGIWVTNLKTKKMAVIKGILKTQKGGLDDYRLRKYVLQTYGER